jgi:hypothetical protein
LLMFVENEMKMKRICKIESFDWEECWNILNGFKEVMFYSLLFIGLTSISIGVYGWINVISVCIFICKWFEIFYYIYKT